MRDLEAVNILGVNVHCLDRFEIFEYVKLWSRGRNNIRTILYVNAHCLNIAYKDTHYSQILSQADLVYADGISIVWSARLFGVKHLQKMTGADWIHDFCRFASANEVQFYVLAGKSGVSEMAIKRLQDSYPNIRVSGVSDGYFEEKEESQVLEEINKQKPEVVFVGMGTPKQENWISKNRARIDAPICWAVGALFDYIAMRESRAPTWTDALGLEWLWRLGEDPRGKWRRYLIGNPLFVYRIIKQRFG